MSGGLRILVLVVAALASFRLEAVRHIGFQTDAFNRVYPSSYLYSMVFSPASFEIDCAIIAESLSTIPKAAVSKRMGVVLDYESTYRPVLEAFESRTNGLAVIAARGFCVPDVAKASVAFRRYLESVYGAEVMRLIPSKGAESWFRAAMDGHMEEFKISTDSARANRYSFFDMVSVTAEFLMPFPASPQELRFTPDPESPEAIVVPCWADVRPADTWETEEYTLLRLPLKDQAALFVMLPKEGYDLSPAKQDMTSVEIDRLLLVTKSLTEKGVSHEPCFVVLPQLEMFSRTNFASALMYFRIPQTGLDVVAPGLTAHEFVQYTRFKLVNRGATTMPAESSANPDKARRFVANRPFLFFVYHEPTATIPIAGQFFGRSNR